MSHMLDAIVVGGGISGLACGFRLKVNEKSFLLFEQSSRVGGTIESQKNEGFLVERGPNSVLSTPEMAEMSRLLGLNLMFAPKRLPRFIYHDGRLKALPANPIAFFRSSLFSWKGKLRLFKEPFLPKRLGDTTEESVAHFMERRFGKEALDRAVAPFVSGIFAGDAETLSVSAAFPRLVQLEEDYGSILKGMIKTVFQKRAAPEEKNKDQSRPKQICSFPEGLESLPLAIEKYLKDHVRKKMPVRQILKQDDRFSVATDEGVFYAKKVILATPAQNSAKLLEGLDEKLAKWLSDIPYAPLTVVSLGFSREDVPHALKGFGFLVPRWEPPRILGTIWNSSLFPDRAPAGYHLLTSFVGGVNEPQISGFSDDAVLALVRRDLSMVLGIQKAPRFYAIRRYKAAIPHYNIGHTQRCKEIDARLAQTPGLYLIGNYLSGVSVGDCIRRGIETASKI